MAVASEQKYKFETGVYRPPSEDGSASLLVRFTRNCPFHSWPGTPIADQVQRGEMHLLSATEHLREVRQMVAALDAASHEPLQLNQPRLNLALTSRQPSPYRF
jgi:hypothetical protein